MRRKGYVEDDEFIDLSPAGYKKPVRVIEIKDGDALVSREEILEIKELISIVTEIINSKLTTEEGFLK